MSKRKESKMGRGFFKETLKNGEKKTAAAAADSELNAASLHGQPKASDDRGANLEMVGREQEGITIDEEARIPNTVAAPEDEKKTEPEGATEAVVVFDDVTVCCYLKCRRRVLAAARKASARGKDWECVNGQAGMMKAWIDEYALKNGIVPNFSVELKPIAADTKVVSVKCIGGHPSRMVLIVETIADAKRCFARVRNLDEYPISLGEVFDCIEVNGHLEWVNKYNSVKY